MAGTRRTLPVLAYVTDTEQIPVGDTWYSITDNSSLETIVVEEADPAARLVGIATATADIDHITLPELVQAIHDAVMNKR